MNKTDIYPNMKCYTAKRVQSLQSTDTFALILPYNPIPIFVSIFFSFNFQSETQSKI